MLVHSTMYTVGAQAKKPLVYTIIGRFNTLTVYSIGVNLARITVYTSSTLPGAFSVHQKGTL